MGRVMAMVMAMVTATATRKAKSRVAGGKDFSRKKVKPKSVFYPGRFPAIFYFI